MAIPEQEYFDNAVLMVAMVKAGVELSFEAMVNVGMKPESACTPRSLGTLTAAVVRRLRESTLLSPPPKRPPSCQPSC